MPRSSKLSLSFRCSKQNYVCMSPLTNTYYRTNSIKNYRFFGRKITNPNVNGAADLQVSIWVLCERIMSLSGGIISSQISGDRSLVPPFPWPTTVQSRDVDQYLVFAILRPFSHRRSNKKKRKETDRALWNHREGDDARALTSEAIKWEMLHLFLW
jgi:hypothetical protein